MASKNMMGLIRVVLSPPPQLLLLRNNISGRDDEGSSNETLYKDSLPFSEELPTQVRQLSFMHINFMSIDET